MEAPVTCQCFLPKLKRLCSRPPQPGDIYCYQHNNGKCKNPVATDVAVKVKRKSPLKPNKPVKSNKPVKPNKPNQPTNPGGYLTGVADVDIKILLNLSYDEILKTCRTNKYAASLCADDRLWLQKVEQTFGVDNMLIKSKRSSETWREFYERWGFRMSDKELEILIKTVLRQVHPDTKISSKAVQLIVELIQPLISKFAYATPQEFSSTVLPGELAKHAMKEYTKTGTKEGVIEYLIAEILELSGNAARDNRSVTISQWHVYITLQNDQEFLQLFKDQIKPFPYIDPHMVQPFKKITLSTSEIKEKWRLGLKPNKFLRAIAYYVVLYYLGKPRHELNGLVVALGYTQDDSNPIRGLQVAILSSLVDYIDSKKSNVRSRIGFEEILDATINNKLLNQTIPVATILAPGILGKV